MSGSGVQIFEGEELLQETSGNGLGVVNWLSPVNIILAVLTMGLWYVVPLGRGLLTTRKYVITDERIVMKTGLVGESTEQINFDDVVDDIRTEQGSIQGVLNVGDVTFTVQHAEEAGGTTGNVGDRSTSERNLQIDRDQIRLEAVENHDEVANTIRRLARD